MKILIIQNSKMAQQFSRFLQIIQFFVVDMVKVDNKHLTNYFEFYMNL